MQVSSDFTVRLTGTSYYQVPKKKKEVDDEKLISIIGMCGQHNIFIDISRCVLLTSVAFTKLSLCKSLIYLDISYTTIETLNIIAESCLSLKSLNFAGCNNIINYQPLLIMISLEFLSLRLSNFESEELLQNLQILRSLDLGWTKIKGISSISNFTRLEELLLDGCMSIERTNTANVSLLDTFSSLENLKLLDINNSAFSDIEDNISKSLNFNLCIEKKSRRLVMVDAIEKNDVNTLYNLISSGEDADLRIGSWGEAVLQRAWKSRCNRPGPGGRTNSTPYFQCSHHDESLRPNLVSIAIFFNATECLQSLIYAGVSVKGSVWFGEVRDDGNILVGNDSKPLKLEKSIFTISELVLAVFDSNVHRLTEGMFDKKILAWKSQCKDIFRQLRDIVNLNLSKRNYEEKKSAEEDDDEKEEAYPTESDYNMKDSGVDKEITVSKLGMNADTTVPIPVLSHEQTSKTDGADEAEEVQSKPMRKVLAAILPPSSSQFSWRDHPMVKKLIGEPVIVVATGSERDLKVLGKKSFWMESSRFEVQRRLLQDDEAFEKEKCLWPHLSKEQKKSFKLKAKIRHPFKSMHPPYYQPDTAIGDRKAEFLKKLEDEDMKRKEYVYLPTDTVDVNETNETNESNEDLLDEDESSWKS